MRRVLMTALVSAAFAAAPATPAQAALVLVGTFSGNQCTGGGITTCYASLVPVALTQVGPHGTPVPGASPGIARFDAAPTTTATFSDSITINGSGDHILSFLYSGSEVATFLGIFQGGGGLNCVECNNTYQLFYDAGGITSGSINLNTYFANSDAISHLDLFDNGGGPVPEPATWAMMLLGFGGIGMAMRRGRKANGRLLQVA
jgi:hypothetical protein